MIIKGNASVTESVTLLEGERLDDLMTENGLRIIQSREVFSFSLDAVLLSKFASVPKRGRILDLCTGNGVIPFLLTTRTNAQIDGVEIQPRLAEMARRSNRLNGLEHQVNIMEGDLKEYVHTAGYGVYDAITVNPPYMQVTTGEQNENEHYAIARHEMLCTLEDVVEAAAKLVKSGGKVAMVHRPARLLDIVESMRRWKLEPKRLQFVHPRADGEANMVLIEAMRDGKPELRLLPPIIIYE